MSIRIKTSEEFEEALEKLDKSIIIQITKLMDKITNYPEIGKPMKHARKGTREVYAGPFRLSYAYDKENNILYFLKIYHKDEQ